MTKLINKIGCYNFKNSRFLVGDGDYMVSKDMIRVFRESYLRNMLICSWNLTPVQMEKTFIPLKFIDFIERKIMSLEKLHVVYDMNDGNHMPAHIFDSSDMQVSVYSMTLVTDAQKEIIHGSSD